MPGPPKKPTALRLLNNNASHRPINKNEPVPPAGFPDMPKGMSADAKKEWKRIAPVLYDMGVLSTIDTAALEAYCECYARWRKAERELAKSSMVYMAKGYPILNPYLSIANKAMVEMRRFMQEFGITPASRSRISTSGAQPAKASANDPYAFLA